MNLIRPAAGAAIAAGLVITAALAEPTTPAAAQALQAQASAGVLSNSTQDHAIPAPAPSPFRTKAEKRSWPVILEGRMNLGMGSALGATKPREQSPGFKISWQRRADCLDHNLQIVVSELSERFGNVLVTSTCRSRAHNRRVGGVKNSQHIGGHAVDFYLYGNVRKARAFLRAHRTVGGLGYYGSGRFHVDNGPRRNW